MNVANVIGTSVVVGIIIYIITFFGYWAYKSMNKELDLVGQFYLRKLRKQRIKICKDWILKAYAKNHTEEKIINMLLETDWDIKIINKANKLAKKELKKHEKKQDKGTNITRFRFRR